MSAQSTLSQRRHYENTRAPQGWRQEIPCETPQGWCRGKHGRSSGSLPPGPTCCNTQESQKAPSQGLTHIDPGKGGTEGHAAPPRTQGCGYSLQLLSGQLISSKTLFSSENNRAQSWEGGRPSQPQLLNKALIM